MIGGSDWARVCTGGPGGTGTATEVDGTVRFPVAHRSLLNEDGLFGGAFAEAAVDEECAGGCPKSRVPLQV